MIIQLTKNEYKALRRAIKDSYEKQAGFGVTDTDVCSVYIDDFKVSIQFERPDDVEM